MIANSEQKTKRSRTGILIAALSILGMVVMAYLAYLKFTEGASSFCDLSEGLSCSAVNQSIYSEIFGIPVAILGFSYFALVLGLVLSGAAGALTYPLILFSTIASFVFSLYLTYAEIFILETICIFCEFSKVLMLFIGAAALRHIRLEKIEFKTSWLWGALLIGVLGIGTMYITQRSTTPSKNYDAFAQCLTEEGWAMYGTYWCPNCIRQKRLFGDSFAYVEEVECDPRGDNPQTDRCLVRNIEKTPTWIRESTDNETEFERHIGVQSMDRLSEISGCPLEPTE